MTQDLRRGMNTEMDHTDIRRDKKRAHAIAILGTRGVPARHGGFETFAERLALHLTNRGWAVTVYCMEARATQVQSDWWRGVRRVVIGAPNSGPFGTMVFDWLAIRHAAHERQPCLTLGYNTALFSAFLKVRCVPNVINMDGIEWRRQKWGPIAKAWFYFNEWAGCWLGDRLVADNPEIARHLTNRVSPRRITVIPYGSDKIDTASELPIQAFGLESGGYVTLVARLEPENSVLEVIRAFSCVRRNFLLAIVGRCDPGSNRYHARVVAAAGKEVRFLGAIYDQSVLSALRFHCAAYVHGHQVGGTNPSLVEALGAGNPVIAHDNRFNRWVAGAGAKYFSDVDQCAAAFDVMLRNKELLRIMSAASRARHLEAFQWSDVLGAYERLLSGLIEGHKPAPTTFATSGLP